MPDSSDSCARVCEILLLFELLKRRRPDLNFGRGESLLSLVGNFDLARLVPPSKSRAGRVIAEGLLLGHLPHAKARPKTPLAALVQGLEVAPDRLPPETQATRVREEGLARSSRRSRVTKDVFLNFPLPQAISMAGVIDRRARQLMKPLKPILADDRAQNLACSLAIPFAFKAVTSGNAFLTSVGAVTLLGCGVEIAVDDPQFMGPGLLEQLPEFIQGAIPGGR